MEIYAGHILRNRRDPKIRVYSPQVALRDYYSGLLALAMWRAMIYLRRNNDRSSHGGYSMEFVGRERMACTQDFKSQKRDLRVPGRQSPRAIFM